MEVVLLLPARICSPPFLHRISILGSNQNTEKDLRKKWKPVRQTQNKSLKAREGKGVRRNFIEKQKTTNQNLRFAAKRGNIEERDKRYPGRSQYRTLIHESWLPFRAKYPDGARVVAFT
jgi:hypothetical protein